MEIENDGGELDDKVPDDYEPTNGSDQLVDQRSKVIVLFKPDDPVNERKADAAADNRDQDGDGFYRTVVKERLEVNVLDDWFSEIAHLAQIDKHCL